jgi:hypothetical protein
MMSGPLNKTTSGSEITMVSSLIIEVITLAIQELAWWVQIDTST